MIINILIDHKDSFFLKYKSSLINELKKLENKVYFSSHYKNIKKGDLLIIIATKTILGKKDLKKNIFNINVHPSNLPKGRGGAAVIWNILNNKNYFYLTLHEATEKVDSGDIYLKKKIFFNNFELSDAIREKQATNTIKMILKLVKNIYKIKPIKQKGKPTYLKKRTPKDSEVNINQTIKSQFNLLRSVDNERYPAFFMFKKRKFILKIFESK